MSGHAFPRRRGVLLLVLGAALAGVAAPPAAAQVVVRADLLHTVSGEPLENAVVIAGAGGTIEWIGPADEATLPDGVEVLEAAVVTPGLDAHSVVGLAGALNSNAGQVRDQDQLDTSAPIQPALRAIDAYDATERLVEWVRFYGVTTLHTGHGPGALISGQTMIVKTRGRNVEEATMVPARMLAATLGNAVSSNFESPGTSSKGVAMLRGALFGAQAYNERMRSAGADGAGGEPPPARDLTKEVLGRVLEGQLSLDSSAESYLLLEEIRNAAESLDAGEHTRTLPARRCPRLGLAVRGEVRRETEVGCGDDVPGH